MLKSLGDAPKRPHAAALLLLIGFVGAPIWVQAKSAIDFDRNAPSLLNIIEGLKARAADVPVQAHPAPVPLVVFPSAPRKISSWMRAGGWKSERDDPRGWEVGGGVLHLLSSADSVLIGTERGFPRDIRLTPILRLSLKVRAVPRGTNLARKSGDDAALRVYIAFDKDGGVFTPSRTIGYTWTEKEDAGTLIPSAHFSNLLYISLGKGVTPGNEWIVVERDLAADYRRAFPGDSGVPPLKGIALKCDSNDTKTSAESWLSTVELREK